MDCRGEAAARPDPSLAVQLGWVQGADVGPGVSFHVTPPLIRRVTLGELPSLAGPVRGRQHLPFAGLCCRG